MRLPSRPTIYEINTAVWLERLGRGRGRPLALDEVPAAEWDVLATLPVDAVWLMGVWERSPAGLEIASADPELDSSNRAALPNLHAGDVLGSPYCVRDYVVDRRFGGPDALATARSTGRAPWRPRRRRCAGTPPGARRGPRRCRPGGTRAATPSTRGPARRGWARSRG